VIPDSFIVGDCREVLKTFPDGCFDCVCTDPPYGIGAYKGDGKKMALIFPEVLPEIHRVLRPGGALAFFGRWPTFYRWAIAAEEAGFRQRDEVVRDLRHPFKPSPEALAKAHDTVFIGYTAPRQLTTFNGEDVRQPYVHPLAEARSSGRIIIRQTTRLKQGWKPRAVRIPNPNGAWPSDVWSSCRIWRGKEHPAQKWHPDLSRLVKLLTNEGDLVLDPFCGAGTIPLACANLGRHYVAVDIEPHWIDVSEKRLAEAASKRNLTLPMEATPA
jgi:site-specific DNA-methyltransferase (adenine-specific)